MHIFHTSFRSMFWHMKFRLSLDLFFNSNWRAPVDFVVKGVWQTTDVWRHYNTIPPLTTYVECTTMNSYLTSNVRACKSWGVFLSMLETNNEKNSCNMLSKCIPDSRSRHTMIIPVVRQAYEMPSMVDINSQLIYTGDTCVEPSKPLLHMMTKCFPHYWLFFTGIHCLWWPLTKNRQCRDLMFSFMLS